MGSITKVLQPLLGVLLWTAKFPFSRTDTVVSSAQNMLLLLHSVLALKLAAKPCSNLYRSGCSSKVPKYHSLEIHASSSTSFDPCLSLNKQSIPVIGTRAIKFPRSIIHVRLDTTTRNQLLSKPSRMLQRVDKAPVTRQQKLLLFRACVCVLG